MEAQDRNAILAICLLAALADGSRSEAEQEEFGRVVSRLNGEGAAGLGERVQRGEVSAAQAARQLSSPEARRLALELATTVIYADGEANPAERAYLQDLKGHLGLAGEEAVGVLEPSGLIGGPVHGPLPSGAGGGEAVGTRPSQAGIPAISHDAALDLLIRQQALIAGALELLPQGIATLAIIPIQMRLVYRIGNDFGQKLDPDQIKDLLGAMGIGATAQLLEGAARRVV